MEKEERRQGDIHREREETIQTVKEGTDLRRQSRVAFSGSSMGRRRRSAQRRTGAWGQKARLG